MYVCIDEIKEKQSTRAHTPLSPTHIGGESWAPSQSVSSQILVEFGWNRNVGDTNVAITSTMISDSLQGQSNETARYTHYRHYTHARIIRTLYARMHACTHACTHARTNKSVRTNERTHAQTRARTHARTNKSTHSCMHICVLCAGFCLQLAFLFA